MNAFLIILYLLGYYPHTTAIPVATQPSMSAQMQYIAQDLLHEQEPQYTYLGSYYSASPYCAYGIQGQNMVELCVTEIHETQKQGKTTHWGKFSRKYYPIPSHFKR